MILVFNHQCLVDMVRPEGSIPVPIRPVRPCPTSPEFQVYLESTAECIQTGRNTKPRLCTKATDQNKSLHFGARASGPVITKPTMKGASEAAKDGASKGFLDGILLPEEPSSPTRNPNPEPEPPG